MYSVYERKQGTEGFKGEEEDLSSTLYKMH